MVERNPFVTVIVTGVPGVGKTTVLTHVASILDEEGTAYVLANFGDYMLKVAKGLGLVSHRDEIRKLPLRKQLELQEAAARLIREDALSELGSDGVLLVDTHTVVKTVTGFWPGLPRGVVLELKPDAIVLVEAAPEVIVSRQERDKTRDRRDIGSVEKVAELMQMARIAAMASATLVSSSVFPVENIEGNPRAAAEKIVELVKMLR
ncbi:MAG: adenylate kinase [Thermoproteota archaeon]